MPDNDLKIRRIPSRKHQSVIPIDYVAPAGAPAEQPVSAYTADETHRWYEIRQNIQIDHLAVFQETPAAFYTGWDLAFWPGEQTLRRRETKRRFQDVPLLIIADATTPTTAAVHPAHVQVETLRRRETTRRLIKPEGLSFYAPPVSADVPFPAWAPIETLHWNFRRTLQALAELNVYPATSPANVMDHLTIHADSTAIQFKSEATNITFSADNVKLTFR